MTSTSQRLSSTHTLDELEKAESSHGNDYSTSTSEHHRNDEATQSHDRVADEKGHPVEQDASSPSIDYSDWNGIDDPDNPHNCMQL
jgi:hypothetical protein